MNERLEIRHGRRTARQIALTMRAVMFEAIAALWIVAALAALAIFW
jgi:hypothetical protein